MFLPFTCDYLMFKSPKKNLAKPQIICDKSILHSLRDIRSLHFSLVACVAALSVLSVVAFVVFKFAGIFRNNNRTVFLSAP